MHRVLEAQRGLKGYDKPLRLDDPDAHEEKELRRVGVPDVWFRIWPWRQRRFRLWWGLSFLAGGPVVWALAVRLQRMIMVGENRPGVLLLRRTGGERRRAGRLRREILGVFSLI